MLRRLANLSGALALLACAPLACPPAAHAQAKNRISSFLQKTLAERSRELVDAAERMPADKYGVKGPPDEVTFGYLALHVADGNYQFCSFIGGVPMPRVAAVQETDPKPVLVERMKSSFDFCAKAIAHLDDSHMSEVLKIGDTRMSRSMAVLTLAGSWATHYDQQQQYLQLAASAPGAR